LYSVITRSEDETVTLGERVGSLLQAGDFIALSGELGSGKTRFVRGVAAGLTVDPATRITSPTYSLLHIYTGRLPLYHFDLYRLAGDADVVELGFAEFFYGDGVCLVEWADRLQEEKPAECLTITFFHVRDDTRRLVFTAGGGRYEELLKNLFPQL
jgi:tRNA threonylcarbamoyladenosine biosynthesis protein TsaE